MTLFLLQIAGIVLALSTLPLLAELLVLTVAAWLPPSDKTNAIDGSQPFPLTVVVPAHNEEALIDRCVSSIVESADRTTEVLVVAHNCTDETAAKARTAGARVLVLNDPDRRGKGQALNFGFQAALAGASQAVLVIDADSVVCSEMIAAVRNRFLDGAQALQCRYEVNNSQDNWRTSLMTLAFRAFNVIRPRGRNRLGLSAGVFGNGFAIHRDVLTRIPYGSFSVVEDLQYHLELVRSGIRVEFVDSATVRGEMPISAKGARTQRARWEGGRLQMMMHMAPRLVREVLCGRLRLVEPLLDLLSLPITSAVVVLVIAGCLPFEWLRFYVASGIAVLLLHVSTAAVGGPGLWETLKALVTAPAHLLWKVSVFPDTLRAARTEAVWVRTERETVVNRRKPESDRRFRINPIL